MSDPSAEKFVPVEKRKRSRNVGCRLSLLFLLLAACTVVSAVVLVGVRYSSAARAGGVYLEDADPSLNLAQRIYLQVYLANRVDALQAPAGERREPMAFQIEPGASAGAVVTELVEARLLSDRELFLNYLQFYGLDSRLQSGQFTIDGQLTIPELASTISQGSARDIMLNFLPGMRLEEIGEYLAVVAPANIDSDAFLALARRQAALDLSGYSFLTNLPTDATLEGYLFPGAYTVSPQADATNLINLMLQNFNRQVTPRMRQAYGARGLTLHEAVTLASIVERETMRDEERGLIASVYLNRVAQEMPLQADPTVQYAVGYQPERRTWWKVPLELSDLRLQNPYNTYVVESLPPGPIANPGLASLQAIAEPEESDYLFFVLDCLSNPPRHLFSRTFDEHLQNVQRCQ